MPKSVAALDTSVLVGLMNPADVWHAPARQLTTALANADWSVIVFDCVVAEAVSVLTRRLHEKGRTAELTAVLTRIQTQFPATAVTFILPDVPQLYTAVLQLMQATQGALNFNDALITLACQQRTILHIASFDSDFDTLPWLQRLTHETPTSAFRLAT